MNEPLAKNMKLTEDGNGLVITAELTERGKQFMADLHKPKPTRPDPGILERQLAPWRERLGLWLCDIGERLLP